MRRPLIAGLLGAAALAVLAVVLLSTSREPAPDFAEFEAGPERKAAFFAYFQPIIAAENDAILRDRRTLLAITDAGKPPGRSARRTLHRLAEVYADDVDPEATEELLRVLLRRVDVIPESLVLAQAAKESGWGTSRFATEGNNYFGQRCWTPGCGITPAKRARGQSFELSVFPTPRAAVASYLRNLNTHDRYLRLRAERAALRRRGESVTGLRLAEHLTAYSTRGPRYVADIKSLIRVNKLESMPASKR